MAFVPFTKDDKPTMEAFNEKFEQAIEEALARGSHLETGTYVGTGTYGMDNPCVLSFDRVPKIVFVSGRLEGNSSSSYGYPTMVLINGVTAATVVGADGAYSSLYGSTQTVSWSGESVEWYNTGNSGRQMNYADAVYHYLAWG